MKLSLPYEGSINVGTKEFYLLSAWEEIPGDLARRLLPFWRCFRLDPCTRKQRIYNSCSVQCLPPHIWTHKLIIRWRVESGHAITRMQIKMLVCFSCLFWLNGQKNTTRRHKWNMVTFWWRQKLNLIFHYRNTSLHLWSFHKARVCTIFPSVRFNLVLMSF